MNILHSKIQRMVMSLTPMGYLLAGAGTLLYLMRFEFTKLLGLNDRSVFITSLMLIGYGSSILLLKYLRGNRLETNDESLLRDELRVLRNEIAHGSYSREVLKEFQEKFRQIENSLKNIKKETAPISDDDQQKIIAEIRSNIIYDTSISLLKDIEEKYSKEFQTHSQLQSIRTQLEDTRLRIRKEIEALGRRGNVNLVIGVLTTIAAVGILTTTVLDPTIKLTNETLVSHFAPRLALSLFVEIFSFFFLKLYKSGLNEIKYFQNELTNVELKFVSLQCALDSKITETVQQVIVEFSKTERNFILEKGQSTVELESSRLENERSNNNMNAISKLVQTIKK